MIDATILYYTSNKEYEIFEDSIQQTLFNSIGSMPIISVSQKPINFGKNICIGDIGSSELNILKQLLIGAIHAKTRFVIPFESDMLCPPDFFDFVPTRDDTFYYIKDVYIIWHNTDTFYRKKPHEFIGVVSRQCLIKTLRRLICMKGIQKSSTTLRKSWRRVGVQTNYPLVTIKTDKQLHKKHRFSKNDYVNTLPYWGSGEELWKKYMCENYHDA